MYPSGPPGQFDWTKLAHCTSACRSCLQLNKTSETHTKIFFGQSPHVGPQGGPDWTKIAHALLDHGANKM